MSAAGKRLIILVHGIRDPAFWQNQLKDHFEKRRGTTVLPIKTEVVDLFRFLFPMQRARDVLVKRVKDTIDAALKDKENKDSEITIIAHSFGTWIVSKILHDDTNLTIDRLILCGGIVPNGFRWDRVLKINIRKPDKRNAAKNAIVNEYSPLDFWPLLAKVVSFGYGNTGARGIGENGITDREHWIPHSGYLDIEFAKTFWNPLVFQNRLIKPKPQPQRTPWYFLVTRIPVNYMFVAILLLSLLIGAFLAHLFNYTGGINLTNMDYQIRYWKNDKRIVIHPELSFEGAERDKYATEDANIYRFTKVSSGAGEKTRTFRALSPYKINQIRIVVSNRPPIKCGKAANLEDPVGEEDGGDREHLTTTYVIDYERESWLKNALKWNWRGTVFMELGYDPKVFKGNDIATDVLHVNSFDGIADGTLKVKIFHSDNQCDEEPHVKLAYTLPSNQQGWISRISDLIYKLTTSVANAAEAAISDIMQQLRSPDALSRSIAIEQIKKDDAPTKDFYLPLISDDSEPQQVIDVLYGLAAGNAATTFDPAFLSRVFELTWSNNRRIRGAARSFLRSPKIASAEVATQMAETIKARENDLSGYYVDSIHSPKTERKYMAQIALRDTYYNYALRISEELSANAERGNIDTAKAEAVGVLRKCENMYDSVHPDVRYSVAKCTYGRALIALRYSQLEYALKQKDKTKGDNYLQILTELRIANARLSIEEPGARDAYDAFKEFLTHVANSEDVYPWSQHIVQAKSCAADSRAIAFNCMGFESPASE